MFGRKKKQFDVLLYRSKVGSEFQLEICMSNEFVVLGKCEYCGYVLNYCYLPSVIDICECFDVYLGIMKEKEVDAK